MTEQQEKIYEIIESLRHDHHLAASLLSDVMQFLDGDLLSSEWIEKKALALSLGKKLTELDD